MVQQLEWMTNESELRELQDELYRKSKEGIKNFRGLMEIILSRVNIDTAIHNMKSNSGSKTPGIDKLNINDILRLDRNKVYEIIREKCSHYKAEKVRRVYIPKGDDPKGRGLGIPTIWDRIIQECIRNILEPIFEGKFYEHSYGFRPMRDTSMAIHRIAHIARCTDCKWVVEGDISKYFDTINHKKLIKILVKNGIKDRRLIMIIKEMLEAGIEGETHKSVMGTPQGGILSPLLANIYLNEFDEWVSKQWENKEIKPRYSKYENYSNNKTRMEALYKSNMKRGYLIRYADDWIILTNNKADAEWWKTQSAQFLNDRLGLRLSLEKTKITNVCKTNIQFLGIELKLFKRKGYKNNTNKWKVRTRPIESKLNKKIDNLQENLKKIKLASDKDNAVNELNIVNSQIRGIVNYYEVCTEVNKYLKKASRRIDLTGLIATSKWTKGRIEAEKVNNLLEIHKGRKQRIPYIEWRANENSDTKYIGLTNLGFSSHKETRAKNQDETPYSNLGRNIYSKRTGKKRLLARADEILSLEYSNAIVQNDKKNCIYNYEFYLNRAYAFNRDKGRCKICNCELNRKNVEIHHKNRELPIESINKVKNLVSLCRDCHKKLHEVI